MKPYGRKYFPSRGKLPQRDVMLEIVNEKRCSICGEYLYRKQCKSGRMEDWGRFMKRKTCGREYKDGKLTNSECLRKSQEDKGNSNYKGILPKCSLCGKKLKTYPAKRAKGIYCKPCYVKAQKGIHPPQLIKYAFAKGYHGGRPFKKGQKPLNKMYETCQIENCYRKHLAKGMCSLHYQRASNSH